MRRITTARIVTLLASLSIAASALAQEGEKFKESPVSAQAENSLHETIWKDELASIRQIDVSAGARFNDIAFTNGETTILLSVLVGGYSGCDFGANSVDAVRESPKCAAKAVVIGPNKTVDSAKTFEGVCFETPRLSDQKSFATATLSKDAKSITVRSYSITGEPVKGCSRELEL